MIKSEKDKLDRRKNIGNYLMFASVIAGILCFSLLHYFGLYDFKSNFWALVTALPFVMVFAEGMFLRSVHVSYKKCDVIGLKLLSIFVGSIVTVITVSLGLIGKYLFILGVLVGFVWINYLLFKDSVQK